MYPTLNFPYVLTEDGQVSLKGYNLRGQPGGAPLVVIGLSSGCVRGQALDICCGGWKSFHHGAVEPGRGLVINELY